MSRSPVESWCSHPGPSVEVSRERFEQLVAQGLDSIPGELASLMENVAVVVENEAANMPNSAHLFGLYQGVPLTGRRGYGGTVPDRITIYQRPISRHCRTEAEIADQVRRTVIHEVGHHFGISDARLRELGW
ncbi:MAG: metallopeptidase family protein [Acidimicrobiales bacterium]